MASLAKGARKLLKTYQHLLKVQNIKNRNLFNKKILTNYSNLKLETNYSDSALRKFNLALEKYGYIKRNLKDCYTEEGEISRNKLEVEIYQIN